MGNQGQQLSLDLEPPSSIIDEKDLPFTFDAKNFTIILISLLIIFIGRKA